MVACGSGRFSFFSNGEPGAAWARTKVMRATKNIVGMISRRRRIVYWSIGSRALLTNQIAYLRVYTATQSARFAFSASSQAADDRWNDTGPASRPARRSCRAAREGLALLRHRDARDVHDADLEVERGLGVTLQVRLQG